MTWSELLCAVCWFTAKRQERKRKEFGWENRLGVQPKKIDCSAKRVGAKWKFLRWKHTVASLYCGSTMTTRLQILKLHYCVPSMQINAWWGWNQRATADDSRAVLLPLALAHCMTLIPVPDMVIYFAGVCEALVSSCQALRSIFIFTVHT